ncbi:transposase [Catenulispora sp. MAP12-49]|uniref:transposase n=1 Tax=unclassified Catenulispora TaxID=414885 RepID=UPI003513447E
MLEIDMDTHRPVDVLPDRESETLAAWLRQHPGVEIVCRDRDTGYAAGIRAGAPDAIQVADRFHLWQNLCKAVNKTVVAHHPCLRQAVRDHAYAQPDVPTSAPMAEPPQAPAPPPRRHYPLADRTRQRFTDVQDCLGRGLSRAATARELSLDLQTVRRSANAQAVEELLVKAENRATKLDGWLDLVNQRWNDGITNAATIHAELRERGFTGDIQTVRRYLKPLRHRGDGRKPGPVRKAPAVLAVPKPGHVSRWLLTHPDHLTEENLLELKKATAACRHLDILPSHIRNFAAIMAERRGTKDFLAWLDAVEADDFPALHSLASGMRRDLPAVINGLTLEHNSGAVEGAVTRSTFAVFAGLIRSGRKAESCLGPGVLDSPDFRCGGFSGGDG